MNDRDQKGLNAAAVLRKYARDSLPDFYGVSLDDVNQRGLLGSYPIHIAAIRDALDDMAALIAGGADVNSQGEDGLTALHWVAGRGNVEAVKLLLKHGARTDIRDDVFGYTPAERAKLHGHEAVVKLLEETGS
jgi:ankyrin repeat protein